MAIGREIAVLVMRARGEGEAQPVEFRAGRRRGDGAADPARRIAAGEAVPIGPTGGEPGDLEMRRIGEARLGDGGAALHDSAQRRVARDLVAERHRTAAHAAGRRGVGGERVGRQPRPQHEPVGRGIAGCDAEAERVALAPSGAAAGAAAGDAADQRRRGDQPGGAAGETQESAARRGDRPFAGMSWRSCGLHSDRESVPRRLAGIANRGRGNLRRLSARRHRWIVRPWRAIMVWRG